AVHFASQISFGDRTAKINERAYKHAGWPAKSKYLLVFLGGGDKLLGRRKPSHIKGMIHSPWREARLGHFSAQLRVSAGRQPTAQDHQNLPSWRNMPELTAARSTPAMVARASPSPPN